MKQNELIPLDFEVVDLSEIDRIRGGDICVGCVGANGNCGGSLGGGSTGGGTGGGDTGGGDTGNGDTAGDSGWKDHGTENTGCATAFGACPGTGYSVANGMCHFGGGK